MAALEADLAQAADQVVRDSIKADIADQLNSGGNVLYTAGGGTAAAGAGRVAQSPTGTRVSGAVATEGGVSVEDAQITNEPLN